MYIHGGRDLKEGAISSMWRVNLTALQQLHQGENKQVGWECVTTTGKDIGKISHHTCCMVSAKEVVFFGGLKGDSSSNSVFLLNLVGNIWSSITPKCEIENIGRDDHASTDLKDGSFIVFGGYVNGSRTSDVIRLEHQGGTTMVATECTNTSDCVPSARAGAAIAIDNNNLFMFGGQEDDNKKMNDCWCFDMNACKWS